MHPSQPSPSVLNSRITGGVVYVCELAPMRACVLAIEPKQKFGRKYQNIRSNKLFIVHFTTSGTTTRTARQVRQPIRFEN